jgi:hypothetical protein
MGILSYGLTLCFVLVTFYFLRRTLEEKKPLVFDGYYHPEFKPVADVFRQVYSCIYMLLLLFFLNTSIYSLSSQLARFTQNNAEGGA